MIINYFNLQYKDQEDLKLASLIIAYLIFFYFLYETF